MVRSGAVNGDGYRDVIVVLPSKDLEVRPMSILVPQWSFFHACLDRSWPGEQLLDGQWLQRVTLMETDDDVLIGA